MGAPHPAPTDPLDGALAEIRHYLPDQGPIDVFIHHNTLHAFEHLPFHQAVVEAAGRFGARPYRPAAEHVAMLAQGRIERRDIEAELDRASAELGWTDAPLFGGACTARTLRLAALLNGIELEDEASVAWHLIEDEVLTRVPAGLDASTKTKLFGGRTPGEVLPALFAACKRAAGRMPSGRGRPLLVNAKSLRHRLLDRTGEDVYSLVHPLLIRACAAYLDAGIAFWEMPDRRSGFYSSFSRILVEAPVPPLPWVRYARDQFALYARDHVTSREVVLSSLADLGIEPEEYESFLSRTLLALRGWAGMFSRLEQRPFETRDPHIVPTLMDFLAIRLVLLRAAIRDVASRHGLATSPRALRTELAAAYSATKREVPLDCEALRLFRICCQLGVTVDALDATDSAGMALVAEVVDALGPATAGRIYLEAYERRYRVTVLDSIAAHRPPELGVRDRAKLQVVCCIDDREESLRRALEELDPGYETFGTAGFFGLAINYQSLTGAGVPLCPAVVTPKHSVVERPIAQDERRFRRWARGRAAWLGLYQHTSSASRSALLGAILTVTIGVLALIPMTFTILAPRSASRLRRWFTGKLAPTPRTRLQTDIDYDDVSEDDLEDVGGIEAHPSLMQLASQSDPDLQVGFTVDEEVAQVATLLEELGIRRFAPIVVVLGHGSTSQNNPHLSAYGCGACGGRGGGANARTLAAVANLPRVRRGLRERGIDIPDDTIFLGGFHDTCSCAIDLFDLEAVPASHRARVAELRQALDAARCNSALERCRRFSNARKITNPRQALRHVEARSMSIAEPRPEYGHATNATCIVGRRELTLGLFLDRRAFLTSYDPLGPNATAALERILGAVIPVCAGISLEYFFSATDNDVYGAGTKLPHNVVSLVGVMNGYKDDLRTGLVRQMVEIHEPMRILFIVESTPEQLDSILGRRPALKQLADHSWLQLVLVDPVSGAMVVRDGVRWVPYQPSPTELTEVKRSADWFVGRSEHLPPARISASLERGAA